MSLGWPTRRRLPLDRHVRTAHDKPRSWPTTPHCQVCSPDLSPSWKDRRLRSVQVDMNAYTTPVVKRLSVAVAAATVTRHPSGVAASLPVPTTAGASANRAARTSITTATPSARTSNANAAASGDARGATAGPGATTGDASVMALQQRLATLGYDVGAADGRIGERTTASVMAFQKVEGLARTGTAGPEVTAALAKAVPPRPLVPGGEATRVEIDLSRQVLLFFDQGRLARILPVSTGSRQRCCHAGVCQNAITPKGAFHVGRK